MSEKGVRGTNAGIWNGLYGGGLVISYPSDAFVRVAHRLLSPSEHPRALDYGFGSGQNAAHLLKRGFTVSGVEASAEALKSAAALLTERGLKADLKLSADGRLPWPDASFDAVIAWSVLEYNDWKGLAAAVAEIERVLRPGGVFLGAINAPGDFKHKNSRPIGDGVFVLDEKTGQSGATVIVPERSQLSRCFPGRALTVGEYGHEFGPSHARHWILSYTR